MDNQKFCKICGNQLRNNDRFCIKCGYQIEKIAIQDRTQYGQSEILIKYEGLFKIIIIVIVVMGLFMIGSLLISDTETESNSVDTGQNNTITDNYNTNTNDTNSEENKNKDLSKANIGDAYVEIGKHKVVKYSDDNILIVNILYTNNSSEAEEFAWNVTAEAYQNGVELDSPFMQCSWYDKNDSYVDTFSKIQPNKTVTVRECFYLRNIKDNVEFTLKHYFWENTYDKAKKILIIK